MLKWYEENGKHLGFDDDTYVYRVFEGEDGWTYENIPDLYGFEGFETAEEAKAAAEEEYEQYEAEMRHLLDMAEPIDSEEAFMVLADLLYEQRKEEQMGW